MQLFVEGSEKGVLKMRELLNYLRKRMSEFFLKSLKRIKAAIHRDGDFVIHIRIDFIVRDHYEECGIKNRLAVFNGYCSFGFHIF
jgi:hypothetical protein